MTEAYREIFLVEGLTRVLRMFLASKKKRRSISTPKCFGIVFLVFTERGSQESFENVFEFLIVKLREITQMF